MNKIHISNRFRVITHFMDFKKMWTYTRVYQKLSKLAILKILKSSILVKNNSKWQDTFKYTKIKLKK